MTPRNERLSSWRSSSRRSRLRARNLSSPFLRGWYLEGDADDGLFIGYAGLSAGWLFFPDSIASVGAWLTAGMGGYVRTDPDTGDRSEGGFVVIEPEVCAFVAVTPSSRISIGASFRLGIPVEGTTATLTDLSGPSAFLALRCGAIRPTPPEDRSRFSLAGGIWQKFAFVGGQIARYEGGYTRLVIDLRWAVGAMGYRVADGVEINGNQFAAMESGLGDVVGAPAVLVSPEVKGSLVLTNFCRLNLGLALRGTFPVREVPGVSWLDVSGPTLSLDLCFGAY
jgi:hypothetical protein